MTYGQTITGKDLIALGYHPARWFRAALAEISDSTDEARIRSICDRHMPPPSIAPNNTSAPFDLFITADSDDEQSQIDQLIAGFSELLRTPTVIQGALMPDACEAGPKGTMPGRRCHCRSGDPSWHAQRRYLLFDVCLGDRRC